MVITVSLRLPCYKDIEAKYDAESIVRSMYGAMWIPAEAWL